MAGQIKVDHLQLGDSLTAAVNFVWQTNTDGSAKLARGNVGATTQDILTINSQGAVFIRGSSTNDSAPAGYVGEFVESDVPNASPVALVTSVSKTVTPIVLTAGDWDVSATIASTIMNTTTEFTGSISTVNNTLANDRQARIRVGTAGNLIGVYSAAIQPKRISLSATTTIYLVAQAVFASGSNSAYGTISARRVR